jgi:hypothetical protein
LYTAKPKIRKICQRKLKFSYQHSESQCSLNTNGHIKVVSSSIALSRFSSFKTTRTKKTELFDKQISHVNKLLLLLNFIRTQKYNINEVQEKIQRVSKEKAIENINKYKPTTNHIIFVDAE